MCKGHPNRRNDKKPEAGNFPEASAREFFKKRVTFVSKTQNK